MFSAHRQLTPRHRRILGGDITPGREHMDDGNTKLMPTDNVYSFYLFMGPIERKKTAGGFSANMFLAWLLIGLNLFLQSTILYAVFTTVVAGDVIWRNSIINLEGKSANPLAPSPSKCNPGGSLCMETNGTYSCAPPSVQLAGRWDLLDLNSDGIWTKDEVMEARDELKCQFAVDPLEVFNVFVNFLQKRADVIWLHPNVKSGKALAKPYFDFAKGDIIMCTYRNQEMCPNLLKRGVFDGPLKDGSSPRVGKTIDSALNYCYQLLKPSGICERSLPSAYSVWRKASEKQCLDPVYHKFDYKHPNTGISKSLLTVDYKAVSDYEKGRRSKLFMVYKAIIIMMFLLCIIVEFQDIFVAATWVLTFPSEGDVDEAVKEERDEHGRVEKYTIEGITTRHRMIVGCLTLARLILALGLAWVGVVFLLQDTDYINLLLNGVGLVFVIQIANHLYCQLLSLDLREQCENTEPLVVSMSSVWKAFWIKKVALRDLCRIVCIMALLGVGMYLHYVHIAKPVSLALECTCLSKGAHCFEANEFDQDFWKMYWEHDVPEVFATVSRMKKDHKANDSEVSDVDVDAPPATNFIHKGLHSKAHAPTTLTVHASDLEVVPLQSRHAHHESHHRVTRLLNGLGMHYEAIEHGVKRLLNIRKL